MQGVLAVTVGPEIQTVLELSGSDFKIKVQPDTLSMEEEKDFVCNPGEEAWSHVRSCLEYPFGCVLENQETIGVSDLCQ